MTDFELVLREEGADVNTYPVPPGGLTIGRASTCGLVLPGALVSRCHALVRPHGDILRLEDQGSTNGVIIKGRKETSAELADGDEFAIGPFQFRVRAHGQPSDLPETGALITYESGGKVYERIVREGRSARLTVLLKASQLLGDRLTREAHLSRALGLVKETYPDRRACVLGLNETGKPSLAASWDFPDGLESFPVSRTLTDQVFVKKCAVLTVDAQRDERFRAASSIMEGKPRSIMCVPLCGREAVEGALYLESEQPQPAFTNSDLELVTAVGRIVGVGLENARLHAEAVVNERLAAIGSAAAGIGHCVKNILTGMKGGGELLDLAIRNEEWGLLRKGWPIIQSSIDRVEEVVLNLLSFSRDYEPILAEADVGGLVRNVAELLRPRAAKLGVDLVYEPGFQGRWLLDGRAVFRVLLNLTLNALDACEEVTGGRVTLTANQSGSDLHLVVRDNGCGIPPKDRERLFEAFYTTKGSRGTGLGLACSAKVAQEHGGSILVESESGKGSAFTVALPWKREGGERLEGSTTEPLA